ncbi:hypothetical protein J5839_00210 [Methanosarcinaceae archaeon]|nr:hypothetical protein [Methanosarcinaceae archaeon]
MILMLTSVVGISAASAASVDYTVPVTINGDALVLTNDVPTHIQAPNGSWILSGPVGDFVPAKSVYGALRTAYAYEFIGNNGSTITTLDVDYSGDDITQINNYSTDGTNYVWTAFIGENQTENLSDSVSNGDIVTFFMIDMNLSENCYASQNNSAVCAYHIPVTVSNVSVIFDGNVTNSSGMTGVTALQAASGNNTVFTCNISTAYGYAWLQDINGISPDYYKTGYGWAILLNGNWTSSLDTTSLSTGDTLSVWMMPSADAGNFNGTVVGNNTEQFAAGYYESGVTDKVTITVV